MSSMGGTGGGGGRLSTKRMFEGELGIRVMGGGGVFVVLLGRIY